MLLRKFGQEVIRVTAGKRVHGTGSVPGGMNKHVSREDRELLQRDIGQMIAWAQDAVNIARAAACAATRRCTTASAASARTCCRWCAPTARWSSTTACCARATPAGNILLDGADDQSYLDLIEEEVQPWTYMKFPHLQALGREAGWYRVGPLARVQNCDFIPTPLAEAQRQDFIAWGQGAAGARDAGLPLGAHDRGAARGRGDRASCSPTRTSSAAT